MQSALPLLSFPYRGGIKNPQRRWKGRVQHRSIVRFVLYFRWLGIAMTNCLLCEAATQWFSAHSLPIGQANCVLVLYIIYVTHFSLLLQECDRPLISPTPGSLPRLLDCKPLTFHLMCCQMCPTNEINPIPLFTALTGSSSEQVLLGFAHV